MKKWIWLPIFLLLTGCGNTVGQEELMEMYSATATYSAVYTATADFGGIVEYTCAYEQSGNQASVRILAPEEVMGVTAVSDENGTKMVFEDTEILTYLPDNWEFAPVGALYGLLRDLATKNPDSFIGGKTCIDVVYERGDWVKKAKLSANGTAIIGCEFFYQGDMILNMILQ